MSEELSGYPFWDNRGTPDTPFGFVYVAEGTRIGYDSGTIWKANWAEPQIRHYAEAWEVLVASGVHGYEGNDVRLRLDDGVGTIPVQALRTARTWDEVPRIAAAIYRHPMRQGRK